MIVILIFIFGVVSIVMFFFLFFNYFGGDVFSEFYNFVVYELGVVCVYVDVLICMIGFIFFG